MHQPGRATTGRKTKRLQSSGRSARRIVRPASSARCWGRVFLYGAHEEERLKGQPGQLLARRDSVICIGTVDSAAWVSHLKSKSESGAQAPTSHAEPSSVEGINLPATQVVGPLLRGVPDARLPIDTPADHRTLSGDISIQKRLMLVISHPISITTAQCYRFRDTFLYARSRPIRVIVLLGGRDFWSNGTDLNTIEASADPAAGSWRNQRRGRECDQRQSRV
jgi:putative two-component system hydrogenase maturation factor HypX/HoxX